MERRSLHILVMSTAKPVKAYFFCSSAEILSSLKKTTTDDVIRVISAWVWRIYNRKLCGVSSLKDVPIYQAGMKRC